MDDSALTMNYESLATRSSYIINWIINQVLKGDYVVKMRLLVPIIKGD